MNWLRDMIGLPVQFSGVIQDTASTATLVALLTAREQYSNYRINEQGYEDDRFRIYCSTEAHSSIEKAVMMSGMGRKNLVRIGVDETLKTQIEDLIIARSEAKKEKNFERSDAIRDELIADGISIMDTADGTLWEKT